MRAIRFGLVLCLALAAYPAGAVHYAMETGSTVVGVNRSNNLLDVTAIGACAATITSGTTVNLIGCRDRYHNLCPTGLGCDLERVPEFRCSYTTPARVGCLWPNGAGFCNVDPNIGCLTNAHCPTGQCNLSTNNPACACQGTDTTKTTSCGDTPATRCFEQTVCGSAGGQGICSDGDGELNFPATLHGSLGTAINVGTGSDDGTNIGTSGGNAFSGPRSAFENPPILVSTQRAPGLSNVLGAGASPFTPLVEVHVTSAYDFGPIEADRGGIRKVQIRGDSFWQDVPFGDQDATGAPVSSNGPYLHYCVAPSPEFNDWYTNLPTQGTCSVSTTVSCVEDLNCPTGETCNRTQYCHQVAGDSYYYIWTADIPPTDFLPAGSDTTNLDKDADGNPDCPPHCKLDYDIDTLEQMTLEGVSLADLRAGAQLSMEFASGTTAGANDLLGFLTVESSTWASANQPDMRCYMGGDPAVVCAVCGTPTPGKCGATTLDCVTDADCQQYVGRCASATGLGSQLCDPLDNGTNAHTDCPAGQSCHACYGPVAVGACVDDGSPCRVNSDCAPSTCGVDTDGGGGGAGTPYYPEVMGPNPLGLPVGYNTYGFTELELDTKCNGAGPSDDVLGRIGIVAPMPGQAIVVPPRLIAVPLTWIPTTGKAASQVVDLDDNTGTGSPLDDAVLGRANGAAIGISDPTTGLVLSGGTFTSGTIFPVDPTGPPCCTTGVNIVTEDPGPGTSLKDTRFGNSRPWTTPNASGDITWPVGDQGTPAIFPNDDDAVGYVRAASWGSGANRVVGCIGDNQEVTGQSKFPDAGMCNDALGSGLQDRCTGDNCTNLPENLGTGADDTQITATIPNFPASAGPVGAMVARAKIANAGTVPTIYAVLTSTGIDIDLFPQTENIDYSFSLETMTCPMRGTCAGAPATVCYLDSDCGVNGPCQNRERTCANPYFTDTDGDGYSDNPADSCPLAFNIGDGDDDGVDDACDPTPNDRDGDGLSGAADSCPTIAVHIGDPDGDGVDNACDNCIDKANPPFAGTPTNRTLTGGGGGAGFGGQLDDDADGWGNLCDYDFDNLGNLIGAGDTAGFRNGLGPPAKNVGSDNCDPDGGGAQPATSGCGIFDVDESGALIGAGDTAGFRSGLGPPAKNKTQAPLRKCAACVSPWSRIGFDYTIGKPECQNPVEGQPPTTGSQRCTYDAPTP